MSEAFDDEQVAELYRLANRSDYYASDTDKAITLFAAALLRILAAVEAKEPAEIG